MWMARYILLRLGEEMGAHVVFEPKPIKGGWVIYLSLKLLLTFFQIEWIWMPLQLFNK